MSNLLSAGDIMLQLESQKQVSNGTPLQQQPEPKINVIELTLLLKSMGFRLNYLEYENNPSERPTNLDITVEIKCGYKNLVSRLSAPSEICSCPARADNDHNSSFWEVMGTAPSSSPNRNKVADTSSNLLPELSKKGICVTRNLLGLIFDVFRKDRHTDPLSPERRKEPQVNNFVTSTMIKSPRRVISVDPVLLRDEFSPSMISVPPNTPRLPGGASATAAQSAKNREHSVYMELKGAKDRLEKALLFMKINMADEGNNLRDPPLDLCTHKAFFEDQQVPLPVTPIAKSEDASGSSSRRSSLGAYANIKSRIDTGAAAGPKTRSGLARHKTNVDAAAASKAKSTIGTRANLLLPRKASSGAGTSVKKVSPLGRTQSVTSARPKPLVSKRPAPPPTVGIGSLK